MSDSNKPVRVWADGCFDLVHWGHLRVFQQARSKGDQLVVGMHDDADITHHKGPPLTSEEERYFCARACRWVDEVAEGAPYVTYLETLDKHNIDFCVHGQDITTDADGNDCYSIVRKAGRFKLIERTEGVSTSELINRMLAIAIPEFEYTPKKLSLHQLPIYDDYVLNLPLPLGHEPRLPNSNDKVIYIDGSFDLLHSGTLKALRAAKELGTYLIVGIHDDEIVNRAHGKGFPLLSLHERVYSVLSCRWVDAAIPAAPWVVTEKFLEKFNISAVALGESHSIHVGSSKPYTIPKKLGKLSYIKSESDMTTRKICDQVAKHWQKFKERNVKKGELTEEDNQVLTAVSDSSPFNPYIIGGIVLSMAAIFVLKRRSS